MGGLPDTAIAETGSGGYHLWFRADGATPIANGADVVPALAIPPADGGTVAQGKKAKGAQIDIRGEGGYVIVPPSVRCDGHAYTWCPEPWDGIAQPSAAILRVLRKDEVREAKAQIEAARQADRAPPPPTTRSSGDPVRAYAQAALDQEAAELATTRTGGRNDRLNVSAMKLGQLVAAGVLNESEVRSALEGAAQQCGLAQDDGWSSVRATFAKGYDKGLSQPRDLSEIRAKAGRRKPKQDRPVPRFDGREDVGASAGTEEADEDPDGFSVLRMNRAWALVMVGSKAVMLHEDADAPLEDRVRIVKVDGFRQWFSNRFTEIRDAEGKVKTVTFAAAWLSNYRRRQYRGMEFFPDENGRSGTPGYFNTWRGFSVVPKAKHNGYAVLRDHVLNNICEGDLARLIHEDGGSGMASVA